MGEQLTAEYERWCDAFHEGSDAVKRIAQETLDLRAKVERLDAEKYDSSNTTMVETIRQAVAAERERAAKIAEGSLSWCMTAGETEASAIAAAIRAEIASATVSHADGADSTDTRSSDG